MLAAGRAHRRLQLRSIGSPPQAGVPRCAQVRHRNLEKPGAFVRPVRCPRLRIRYLNRSDLRYADILSYQLHS